MISKNRKVKVLVAFKLGEVSIKVPNEVIEYDGADKAYDSDFDDYELKRTDMSPFLSRL